MGRIHHRPGQALSLQGRPREAGAASREAHARAWLDAIEVKHVPDVTDSSTYSLFQFYWIGQRPIAYWQIDYPGASTSRRYVHADEMNRPLEVYSWPSSGDAARAWAINPDAFGWDDIVHTPGLYQPLRFPGQLRDEDTIATYRWSSYFSWFLSEARPALHENRYRYYDPFVGGYLQVDGHVAWTWSSYGYAAGNPVSLVDPRGEDFIVVDGEVLDLEEEFANYGCGSAYQEVPDEWLLWDFEEACQMHDICYRTCGRTKAYCDSAMREVMRNKCQDRPWNVLYPLCLGFAETYYQVVRHSDAAQDAYAREQARCWDLHDPPPTLDHCTFSPGKNWGPFDPIDGPGGFSDPQAVNCRRQPWHEFSALPRSFSNVAAPL